MRIHVASASASVTRTLQALIAAGGHELATAEQAEWMLYDQAHPLPENLPTCPRLTLGTGAAGDILPTPFRLQQLLRLLAARKPSQTQPLGAGWQLDMQARTLTHATQTPVTLTEKETALLHALLQQRAGIDRETLLTQIWGLREGVDTHTLETHLYRLRQKLNELSPPPCDIVSTDGSYKIAL